MSSSQISPPCPDCGTKRSIAISGQGSAFRQPDDEPGFYQSAYHIWECGECSLKFRSPSLSDQELSAYYASLPANHWEYSAFNPPERLIQQRIRNLSGRSRILDFGCSSGRLLEPWVRQHVTYGFEINPEAANLARSRGLNVLDEQELWTTNPASFDLIILVDVFEHLRKPSELLKDLWRLIAPGGQLIVSSGNGDHWACRLDPSQFWYFRNLEHLCMTSERHLSYFAKEMRASKYEVYRLSHYDVPLISRMFIYTAHTLYWMIHRTPQFLRPLYLLVPGLKKIALWKNAPNFGCAKDHLVAFFAKDANQ